MHSFILLVFYILILPHLKFNYNSFILEIVIDFILNFNKFN